MGYYERKFKVTCAVFLVILSSMLLWQAIVLGILQGITEFLPVSSDGHLVLAGILLSLPLEGRDALGFDILLHAGSLLALIIGYWSVWMKLVRDLLRWEKSAIRLALLLIVATIPGVIAGLLFEDTVSGLRSLTAAGIGFIITGVVLITGEYIGTRRGGTSMIPGSFIHALLIGIAQAVAILPGVSRSGSTVSVGRALGLPRDQALDFSFLMAVPIIAGAVAKTGLDAWTGDIMFPSGAVSAAGFVTSLIVSLAAIGFLRAFVKKRSIALFAWYVIPLGAVLLVVASS